MTTTTESPAAVSNGPLASFTRRLWQPNQLIQTRPWAETLGVVCLLVFALLGMSPSEVPEKMGTLSYLAGIIALAMRGGPLRRSPAVWLALAAIGVVLVSWGASWLHHPEWAERSPKVHRLTHWFAMIPIAVWLGGRERNTLLLWALALGGLMIAPWITGDGLAEWRRGLGGERVDFGLHNAQHSAMLFGTGLLGLLAFAPRLLRRGCPWWAQLCWLLAFCTCCAAVAVAQTRAVWLGLAPALLLLGAIAVWRARPVGRRLKAAAAVVLLVSAGAGYLAAGEIVDRRLAHERETIELALSGEVERLPYSSVGIRLHSWVEAVKWFAQRPLLGWGGNGRGLVIEHSEALPDHLKERFGHLHSSYLDLLVSYGLLGAALLLGLLAWLLAAGLGAWRRGALAGDTLTFILTFGLFWLVINAFESYLFYHSGRFVFGLVCGGLLTHIWRDRLRQTEKLSK